MCKKYICFKIKKGFKYKYSGQPGIALVPYSIYRSIAEGSPRFGSVIECFFPGFLVA